MASTSLQNDVLTFSIKTGHGLVAQLGVGVGLDSPWSTPLARAVEMTHGLFSFLGDALHFAAMRHSQAWVLSHITFSLRHTDFHAFHPSLGYPVNYKPATAAV